MYVNIYLVIAIFAIYSIWSITLYYADVASPPPPPEIDSRGDIS